MGKKMTPKDERKKVVTVFLDQTEFDRLTKICESRQQTRADFLRDAIDACESIPKNHKAKLRGICLQRHLDRVKEERRDERRGGKG